MTKEFKSFEELSKEKVFSYNAVKDIVENEKKKLIEEIEKIIDDKSVLISPTNDNRMLIYMVSVEEIKQQLKELKI